MNRALRGCAVILVMAAAGLFATTTPALAACTYSVNPYYNPVNRSNTINNGGCSQVGAYHYFQAPCNGCYGSTSIVWSSTSAWSPTAAYLVRGVGLGTT